MKRKVKWIAIAGAAALIVLYIGGCSLFGTSIEARISMFLSTLNTSDRSTEYLNFHPTLTTDYAAITGVSGLFDAYFPYGTPEYSLEGLNSVDPANVTAMIDGPATFGGPLPITLKMAKDGSDWMIEELFLGGTKIVD